MSSARPDDLTPPSELIPHHTLHATPFGIRKELRSVFSTQKALFRLLFEVPSSPMRNTFLLEEPRRRSRHGLATAETLARYTKGRIHTIIIKQNEPAAHRILGGLTKPNYTVKSDATEMKNVGATCAALRARTASGASIILCSTWDKMRVCSAPDSDWVSAQPISSGGKVQVHHIPEPNARFRFGVRGAGAAFERRTRKSDIQSIFDGFGAISGDIRALVASQSLLDCWIDVLQPVPWQSPSVLHHRSSDRTVPRLEIHLNNLRIVLVGHFTVLEALELNHSRSRTIHAFSSPLPFLAVDVEATPLGAPLRFVRISSPYNDAIGSPPSTRVLRSYTPVWCAPYTRSMDLGCAFRPFTWALHDAREYLACITQDECAEHVLYALLDPAHPHGAFHQSDILLERIFHGVVDEISWQERNFLPPTHFLNCFISELRERRTGKGVLWDGDRTRMLRVRSDQWEDIGVGRVNASTGGQAQEPPKEIMSHDRQTQTVSTPTSTEASRFLHLISCSAANLVALLLGFLPVCPEKRRVRIDNILLAFEETTPCIEDIHVNWRKVQFYMKSTAAGGPFDWGQAIPPNPG
ncbi:hypothetical protein C8F04DRAFT_1182833 [Mycena alexandri]|uniref:Uncharacterized protein n=1 Tax=Mycena alexandri TaxID=1745969 RepID=A0AAD6X323_9AGAR|nr:hypothetical protein C8F04DRAFT_1182833 [Mycena alexandri]